MNSISRNGQKSTMNVLL